MLKDVENMDQKMQVVNSGLRFIIFVLIVLPSADSVNFTELHSPQP